ncbi:uncharacterized protein ACBT44_007086 isoform 1-T4 [Syngnathus typhle]
MCPHASRAPPSFQWPRSPPSQEVTGPLLDPLQFAYGANRSVDDAVNMGLHYILHHLDTPGTYARILFVDFSLAFNTITPDILQQKLIQLAVPASTCQWITSFLTNRRQRVKLLKYADDTTLIGLIQDGDETAYRQEVERLVHWCSENHPELNPLKIVEVTVDFKRDPSPLLPLTIRSNTIISTDTFKFLGTTISRDLKWTGHIDCPEEGPAEAVLPETAQEVQPAASASEDLLHCLHPVCPLHLHHCLVWIGLQTRQAQTTTDNQNCKKDHWNQPPIYPRLVRVQDQESGKEHLYRPFSPRLQSV